MTNLRFVGDAREYFRIWIVNVFLTVLTLGVYSAWAKVRTERYFHGNTLLDDHRFDFVADPVRILRGRLLAVLALVTYTAVWHLQPQFGIYALTALMLALPALLVLAVGFRFHNTIHRNIRFRLDRDILGIYRAVGIPIAVALGTTLVIQYALSDWASTLEANSNGEFQAASLGLLIFSFCLMPLLPYLDFARSRFVASRAHFGTRGISFNSGAGRFYAVYLIGLGLWFLAMLAAFVIVAVLAWMAAGSGDENALARVEISSYMGIGIMYGLWVFVMGFFAARRRNVLIGALRIGDAGVTSELSGLWLGWLYLSNTLAILLSVGLLIPWAKVRTARYVAACTTVDVSSLDSVSAGIDDERSAASEEIGEAFGYDLGF